MLSDEEKDIFNNLKDYMQSKIDNGYHKFIYNDLDWDFKCIDCINAIDKVLKQSKEIEKLKEEKDFDFIVGYTLFNPSGFKTRFRHFDNLKVAEMFCENKNLKNNSKIYVDYDYFKETIAECYYGKIK